MPKNWTKTFTRDYALQYSYCVLYGYIALPKIIRKTVDTSVILPIGQMRACFSPTKEYNAYRKAVSDYYLASRKRFDAFMSAYKKESDSLTRQCAKLSKNTAKTSSKDLVTRYCIFNKLFWRSGSYLWVSFALNEFANAAAMHHIDALTIPISQKDSLKRYASTPSKYASVLLLASKAQKYPLKVLAKKFRWITTLEIHNDPATPSQVNERITSLPKKEVLPAWAKGLPQKTLAAIRLARDAAYLKDVRDDYRRKALCNIAPLFDEIAKRTHTPKVTLSYATIEEITMLLAGTLSAEEVTSRATHRQTNGFMLTLNNAHVSCSDDSNKINKVIAEVAPTNLPSSTNEIRGIIGCKGIAKGRVVIVHGIAQLSKVREGDILCTVTTNVDYLPAMKKAAAFITDEGGLTCHAAIVAREMKKPCIVGTKSATSILKDGDIVEVNAISAKIIVTK